MVQLMPLQPHHICFSKIQNGLTMWYWSAKIVLEEWPLNDCVCVCRRQVRLRKHLRDTRRRWQMSQSQLSLQHSTKKWLRRRYTYGQSNLTKVHIAASSQMSSCIRIHQVVTVCTLMSQ